MLNTKELPVSTQSKRPIATTLPFSLKSIPTPLSDVQQENIKLKRKLRHQQLRFAALHAENKVMRLHIRRSRQNHTIASKPIQQHDNFQRQTTGVLNTSKPKIALIIDSESWAFANIAKQLVKHLQHRFEFRIIPAAIIDNVVQVLLMTADCTLTHFFWRDFLNSASQKFAHHYSHDLGFASHQTFLNEYVHRRLITTSIYDHLFLTPTAINERSALFNNMISGYTVSSQRLMNLYRDIPNIPDPVGLTEDGVDLNLFRPINTRRFNTHGKRAMVIGWAGNSHWAEEHGEDFKGLHTILKPAVKQLQDEGLAIRLELADRQQYRIKYEDMPDYYAKLDLYVCPSKIEGTPNPVLEAMACGVPVISTDVGIVPQAFGNDPFDMILPERSVGALKQRIRHHYASSIEQIHRISDYGLHKIQRWSWKKKAQNFERFFNQILQHKNDPLYL